MEEVIKQATQLLKEGKFEEYENLLVENLRLFPKEVQVQIIAGLIESAIIKETEKLKIFNSILKLLS